MIIFNAQIDNYTNITEITQGDNRIVKTDFTITLQGYLVPKSINKELAKQSQKSFSRSTVIFNNELSVIKTSGPPRGRVDSSGGVYNFITDGIGFAAIGEDFIIF